MPGQLLIGSPNVSWRDWLRQNRNGRDLLIADPADTTLSWPGRVSLWRGDKLVAWRFYGSLSPLRAPHVILGAAIKLAGLSEGPPIVQCFPYRPGPLLRQTLLTLAEVLRPDQILLSSDAGIDLADWPVGPEEIELEKGFPPMVETVHRRAQWIKLLEDCAPHDVSLRNVAIEGSRLGAGTPLSSAERQRIGLRQALHAELCGTTLLVISEEPVDDAHISAALDASHASKIHLLHPDRYQDLLCSFARSGGEDFGMGVIRSIDFDSGRALIDCTAVPPTPVQVLRMGGLRLGADGTELGEVRPWEV